MDSQHDSHLSNDIIHESDPPSDEERDISPLRKHSKAKQKRKGSTISVAHGGRTRNSLSIKGAKNRQSLAATSREMADVLAFIQNNNITPSFGDNLAPFDELPDEHDNKDAEQYITKLTLAEKNMAQALAVNQAAVEAQKTAAVMDSLGVNLNYKPSWLQDDQKNTALDDRLAHDVEFDVTGIMNLSSMNMTDSDLPAVIQRAFWGGRKKCTGLLLRDNCLTAAGVKMIVDTLIAGRICLRYLSFSNNPDIGDGGIEHLVRLLQKSRSIIFLAVPNTGITDRGVRLLADVLCGVDTDPSASPPTLEKLYISFNKLITDESLEVIMQILEQNQTLKVLSVEHCSLSDKARKRLRHMGTKIKKKKFSLSE